MRKKSPQPQDKYVLRMPDGLRDRIKDAAEENNRSMNAEIVGTLEKAYPVKSIPVESLSLLLANLADFEPGPEYEAYLEEVNDKLSRSKAPFTVRTGSDGVVTFYPYASPSQNRRDPEE